MTSSTFLFTSESVTEGHPDKMCDVISDSILDECLRYDPESRVACETCTKTGMVLVFGEITSKKKPDYQRIVRDAIAKIGYTSSDLCFDANQCSVQVVVTEQCPDIEQAVFKHDPAALGAGDQGMMFGYATNETEELMPLTAVLAHKLARQLAEVRKNKTLKYLGPDGKTQVTIEYEENGAEIKPKRIHTIVVSAMHSEETKLDDLRRDIQRYVIDPVIPKDMVDEKTKFIINPGDRFVIGGPMSDAGLTGRKIIVDTYGGWGAHGGGCFSGKDPTKVDRSASYAARWVAKSIVHTGLASRVLIQLAYGIGLAHPISIFVDTYGTGKLSNERLIEIIKANFDLTPYGIIRDLDLRRPIYAQTAAYGHFGRTDLQPPLPWEVPKHLDF